MHSEAGAASQSQSSPVDKVQLHAAVLARFRLAPITEVKGEVSVSQLNLTGVSEVNNKMGRVMLKVSEHTRAHTPQKVVITNPVKGFKWNMFSTHIEGVEKKPAFIPKSLGNISLKYTASCGSCRQGMVQDNFLVNPE